MLKCNNNKKKRRVTQQFRTDDGTDREVQGGNEKSNQSLTDEAIFFEK